MNNGASLLSQACRLRLHKVEGGRGWRPGRIERAMEVRRRGEEEEKRQKNSMPIAAGGHLSDAPLWVT